MREKGINDSSSSEEVSSCQYGRADINPYIVDLLIVDWCIGYGSW